MTPIIIAAILSVTHTGASAAEICERYRALNTDGFSYQYQVLEFCNPDHDSDPCSQIRDLAEKHPFLMQGGLYPKQALDVCERRNAEMGGDLVAAERRLIVEEKRSAARIAANEAADAKRERDERLSKTPWEDVMNNPKAVAALRNAEFCWWKDRYESSVRKIKHLKGLRRLANPNVIEDLEIDAKVEARGMRTVESAMKAEGLGVPNCSDRSRVAPLMRYMNCPSPEEGCQFMSEFVVKELVDLGLL